MKYTTRQELKALAGQASTLAADMRAFKPSRQAQLPAGNVEAVIFDIEQLTDAVYWSDAFNSSCSREQIAHVLEVALKTKVGLFALGGSSCVIDLGNGHELRCTVAARGARA